MGYQITSFQYDNIHGFVEDLVHVQLNGKSGFTNASGRQIISCLYDLDNWFPLDGFIDGLVQVNFENGKFGYIDKNGAQFWED